MSKKPSKENELSEEEIAKYTGMVEWLGKHKSKGFIIMIEANADFDADDDTESDQAADGVLFSSGCDRFSVGINCLHSLFPEDTQKRMFLMLAEKDLASND